MLNPTNACSSRRDFLKASALAASTALAGSVLSRSVHAAGSDVLKIGLIGCGGRGSGAAVNAMNADANVKLIAMADVFDDRLQAAREQIQKAKPDQTAVDDEHCFVGFDGYKQVIESGVDVVLIACASKFHPAYLKAAVDAGKHVFVEKPHAVEPVGLKVVAEACETAKKKNLSVVSGLCWRYDTGVQETMKRVHDGAIGDIVAIQETYMRSPYRLIAREAGWSEIEYQYRNWYHFKWLSGDDIAQSLIHSMDKGAWLMHEEPPVKAYAVGGRAATFDPIHGDVVDHTATVYEYANGVRMYAIGRAQDGCYNEVSDILMGTKGRCDLQKHVIEGENSWRYDGPKCNMYDEEHKVLFSAIRSGQPVNNGVYMIGSTMLGILGQMAVYTGRQITWQQAIESPHRFGPEQCDFNTEPPVKPGADGLYPVPVPGLFTL